MGRRNQSVTVITSMSNTRAVIMHFHVPRLQFDYTACAHTAVWGRQTSPCRCHQLLSEAGPSLRKLPKGHRLLAFSLKVACTSSIFCTSPHNYLDINILHMPRLMIISAMSFLMSSGIYVKSRWEIAVHFNPPMLLTHAHYILLILFHML